MEVPKPTEDDKRFFHSLVPEDPRVDVKPMFGNLGAFVNGNMFMGLLGRSVGVRLGDEDRLQLLEVEGSGPFGPDERPMREYVALPPSWRSAPERAEPWIARALQHSAALPPKKKQSG